MKGYRFKNALISFVISAFFVFIAKKIYLDYTWFLIIYIYIVSLLLGHLTVNTVKPEKKVKVPVKYDNFDKFVATPIVGACEFALYGFIVFVLDMFFNFLPTF